jgi:hypothetical protein
MTCIALSSLIILFGAALAAGERRPTLLRRPIRITRTPRRPRR